MNREKVEEIDVNIEVLRLDKIELEPNPDVNLKGKHMLLVTFALLNDLKIDYFSSLIYWTFSQTFHDLGSDICVHKLRASSDFRDMSVKNFGYFWLVGTQWIISKDIHAIFFSLFTTYDLEMRMVDAYRMKFATLDQG